MFMGMRSMAFLKIIFKGFNCFKGHLLFCGLL